ncbi:hypothetical protein QJU96_09420 [Pasteurella skyensis]|uniref:Lipoprotein n=1 Tax=Phocoenobacter skyensis TaxID=97481 RepID=A0AAJ6NFC5_9PAST|nr:hypothetical protein [Pasteurella skyensis]MDP8171499.1 hypothetical protein [Pasteurella skyensis]MDP8175720.1 hypothetical protein [Pasteurella skyensis]
MKKIYIYLSLLILTACDLRMPFVAEPYYQPTNISHSYLVGKIFKSPRDQITLKFYDNNKVELSKIIKNAKAKIIDKVVFTGTYSFEYRDYDYSKYIYTEKKQEQYIKIKDNKGIYEVVFFVRRPHLLMFEKGNIGEQGYDLYLK